MKVQRTISVKKRQKQIHPSIKLYKISPPPLPCSSCCVVLSLLAVVFFLVSFLFLLSFPFFFFATAKVHSLTNSTCVNMEFEIYIILLFFCMFKKGGWVWNLLFWVLSPNGKCSCSRWYILFKETWNTCHECSSAFTCVLLFWMKGSAEDLHSCLKPYGRKEV